MFEPSIESIFSYENFVDWAKHIVEISDRINDNWKLEENKKYCETGIYLTKRSNQTLYKICADGGPSNVKVVFEYHVVYSLSYNVPVLCFIAWKEDGSLLHLEEYLKYNQNLNTPDESTILTQLDHPVLCRPFLTLHPCKTNDILGHFLLYSNNCVISWLSVFGPLLGLQLDEEYFNGC